MVVMHGRVLGYRFPLFPSAGETARDIGAIRVSLTSPVKTACPSRTTEPTRVWTIDNVWSSHTFFTPILALHVRRTGPDHGLSNDVHRVHECARANTSRASSAVPCTGVGLHGMVWNRWRKNRTKRFFRFTSKMIEEMSVSGLFNPILPFNDWFFDVHRSYNVVLQHWYIVLPTRCVHQCYLALRALKTINGVFKWCY